MLAYANALKGYLGVDLISALTAQHMVHWLRPKPCNECSPAEHARVRASFVCLSEQSHWNAH